MPTSAPLVSAPSTNSSSRSGGTTRRRRSSRRRSSRRAGCGPRRHPRRRSSWRSRTRLGFAIRTSSSPLPLSRAPFSATVDKSAKPVAVLASSSKNPSRTGSSSKKASPVAVLASSSKKASPVAVLTSYSKKVSPAVEPEKGKPVAVLASSAKASPASVVKSTKRKRDGYDDHGSVTPLRKSVRTLQPTSKLLEGLQTSSSVLRIPSFSKAQPKPTPRDLEESMYRSRSSHNPRTFRENFPA